MFTFHSLINLKYTLLVRRLNERLEDNGIGFNILAELKI